MKKREIFVASLLLLVLLQISTSQAFLFSGIVKNESGDTINATNVSVSMIAFGPEDVAELYFSTLSNASGEFTLNVSNESQAVMYILSFVKYGVDGNATHVGPLLPPFPKDIFVPVTEEDGFKHGGGLNGSTVYLQAAGTLRLYARNGSSTT
ncbi:MAG: hypothetical protein AABX59_01045, partial [Nanoarchaeota archaeon]